MSFKDQKELDLDVFVNPDEFGQEATLSQAGVDKKINITVRKEPSELRGIEGISTVFLLKRSDAPYLNKDAIFILNGDKYRVVNIPENFSDMVYPKIYVSKV